MSSRKKPPQPSAAETALLKQKQDLIAQQQALLTQAQAPIASAEKERQGLLGMAKGQITQPPTEAEIRANETQRLYDERLQKALRGDIPLDPTIEREIEQDRMALETHLFRALGPNFAASTPGQEAIRKFNEGVAGRRFRTREAFIAGAEQPSYNRYALGQNLTQQQFERPLTLSGAYSTSGSGLLGASRGYGEAGADIDPLLRYYTNERYTPFNVAEQRRAQTLQGLGQLAGAGTSFYTQGFAMPRAIRSLGGGGGGLGIPYTGNPLYTGNIG